MTLNKTSFSYFSYSSFVITLCFQGVLLALSSDIVIASLTNCAKYETCESCFSDPNCNWQKSEDNLKCQEVYNKTFLNQLQQSDPTKFV